MQTFLLDMSFLFHFSFSLLLLTLTASQWYLTLFIGLTLHEFMTIESPASSPLTHLLSTFTWRDLLYMTFGTTSLLDALIPFSHRELPLSGLEWAYVMDYSPHSMNSHQEL